MKSNNDSCEKVRLIKKKLERYISVMYQARANSNDAKLYATLFHKDARWCAPQIPDYIGRNSIEYGYKLKNGNIQVETFVDEIEVSKKMAFVMGTADVIFFPYDKSGNKKYKHKVIWIFKEKDDVWKIYRQLWNIKTPLVSDCTVSKP